jgi:flagellar hook assembly protein FlgD
VFDILGKEIVVLVKGEQAPGSHQVEWKGTNTTGMPVASGVYFYRLESAGLTKTSKMMLLR